MYKKIDKSKKHTERLVSNATHHSESDSIGCPRLIDNRAGNKQTGIMRKIPGSNSENEFSAQFMAADNEVYKPERALFDKRGSSNYLIQKQHKDIPAPRKEQVWIMGLLNQRNHAIVKKYKMESKGTHGTNWMHAISIMQGIKSVVPKEMRTSDVTPEGGGFFVDISKSGEAHSHDFAKMAAYGTPEEATPPHFSDDLKKRDDFNKHVKSGKGTLRAVILEIWGQKNALPETREKGQQPDEDIYKANANLLVATLKDSL